MSKVRRSRESLLEDARLGQITDVDGHMGIAEDGWPLCPLSAAENTIKKDADGQPFHMRHFS